VEKENLFVMSKAENNLELRAVLLGTMSGMRSISGTTLMSDRAALNQRPFKDSPLEPLASDTAASLFKLASVGEAIADKLPFMPPRIRPLPLLGRALWGGVSGAAAYVEARQPLAQGAALGTASAVVSSFVFYLLRRGVKRVLHLPDLVVALAEDAGVLGIGRVVRRSYE
jgi:uncharacterized membrane protein